MKNKSDWSSGNTVEITGTTVIDCRTRWQRFKDFFKLRRKLVFDSEKRIVYKADSIKMP